MSEIRAAAATRVPAGVSKEHGISSLMPARCWRLATDSRIKPRQRDGREGGRARFPAEQSRPLFPPPSPRLAAPFADSELSFRSLLKRCSEHHSNSGFPARRARIGTENYADPFRVFHYERWRLNHRLDSVDRKSVV